jgi:hypothetical protein
VYGRRHQGKLSAWRSSEQPLGGQCHFAHPIAPHRSRGSKSAGRFLNAIRRDLADSSRLLCPIFQLVLSLTASHSIPPAKPAADT